MPDQIHKFPTLANWVAAEAITFALEDLDTLNAAIDKIVALLGEKVELLGLGEPTHQIEAFLKFRNRVFQRLVEQHGYTAIALESSFPRGRLANEYVSGRKTLPFAAVIERGFSHQFGAMQANRELVEWMRVYNGEHDDRPLRFDGFDGPMEMMYTDSPRTSFHFVLEYLASIDGSKVDARRKTIDELLGDDGRWETEQAAFDPSKSIGLSPAAQLLSAEAEQIIRELRERRDELIAAGDENRYLEAVHDAKATRQLLAYHAVVATPGENRLSNLMGHRDLMQADNLQYIADREHRRGGKVLAFAHNSHLKLGRMEWQLGAQKIVWQPAGLHVRGRFGERYRVIGVGVGTMAAQHLGPPERGTLEALLTAAGASHLIPTHLCQGLPADAISALPERSNPSSGYFPFTAASLADYDVLAVLASAD
jgi:erythromycin esterase-like protein